MNSVDELVDRAIEIAEMVVIHDPQRLDEALTRLERLAAELRDSLTGHPSLKRLEDFLRRHGR